MSPKTIRTMLATASLLALSVIAALLALETRSPDHDATGASAAATAGADEAVPALGPRAPGPESPRAEASGSRPWRLRAPLRPAQGGPDEPRIGGLTEAERVARGITPVALYTSRQATKWMFLAIEARALGHTALAVEAEAMAQEGWRAMEPRATQDPAELLSHESALLERFYRLDDQRLAVRLSEIDASLTSMMQGDEPSVAHKLEVAEQADPPDRSARDTPAEHDEKAAARTDDETAAARTDMER